MHAHHTHTCTHKYASVYSHTHVSLFLYFFSLVFISDIKKSYCLAPQKIAGHL